MPKVCEMGSCSSACRTSQAPLFLPLTWIALPTLIRSRSCNGSSGHAAGEDTAAKKSPLQRAGSVNPATAEAGRLAHGVKPGHGRAVGPQHAALQIRLDAPQALARQDELADGDERHRLSVQDL